VVKEERDREKRIQEDTDKWGMIYMGWERRETEEKFLEEREKKRRRTSKKRYKKEMNKKVDGQRKLKPEKKHKRGKSLPKEYNWKGQGAKREKKKERATGGNNNRGEFGD
jgi:hypothetical protein